MSKPDLNLLYTLHAVLTEGSVTRAARRLSLSPSAMSRALTRLRDTMNDPLLVRAGRGLVPTPRALELKAQIDDLLATAKNILSPADALDLAALARTFVIRSSDGFVENFGPRLLRRIRDEAPGVRLRFLQKPDRDTIALRDGSVDLETGVIAHITKPEIRAQALFKDHFVGVARKDHPLAGKTVELSDYLLAQHVQFARQMQDEGPIEAALQSLGKQREIAVTVGGFAAALALADSTDMLTTVPERHTRNLRKGMHMFELPFAIPDFTVSMLWHPRLDADPAHRWLRAVLREICRD